MGRGVHMNGSGRRVRRARVCVLVCARPLRAAVVLDLCPFGGRKCACAGGVGDVGAGGWRVVGRREGRVGGERKRKKKVRNEETSAAGPQSQKSN